MQIVLVDGTYELFRQFFGAPSRSNQSGEEIGATRALLRSLHAMRRDLGAPHVAIAFDTVIESFRNDLFDGYKTGEGIDPDLHGQFPITEEAAEALGLVVWRMGEFEADDALATFAARASADARVEQVRLASPDKDLGQCVSGERVVMWDRKKDAVLDEAAIRDKFGVAPESIPDYLALVGDSADGIPGIPRWGAKGTAAVLARYAHLEAIPADASAWEIKVRGAASLSRELEAAREAAMLYRTLATLRRDVPLTESVDDLAPRMPDEAALRAICARVEDEAMADRILRESEAMLG